MLDENVNIPKLLTALFDRHLTQSRMKC